MDVKMKWVLVIYFTMTLLNKIHGFSNVVTQENICKIRADVVFVLDGSGSVHMGDFIQEKYFVIGLINKIDYETIKVGMVVYSSGIGDVFSFEPTKTKEHLIELAKSLRKLEEGSNTAIGISKGRHMLNNGRSDVDKYMVVFTDGRAENITSAQTEAIAAKNDNITIIVVGIGPTVTSKEWSGIATSSGNFIHLENFDLLERCQKKILDMICPVLHKTITCENDKENISCGHGKKIKLIDANYGRTDRNTCTDYFEYSKTDCYAERSHDIIWNLCNNKNICTVQAENTVFGDPCRGTYKYLNVTFYCN